MFKKIRLILILVLILVFLAACSRATTKEEKRVDDIEKPTSSMFVLIEQNDYCNVVYHRDTNVMYAISNGAYNHGTFTLLVDVDGNPLLYKKE